MTDTPRFVLPEPLRRYLARSAAQLDSAPEPIWVEDTSGYIAYINPPALALLGYESGHGLFGTHWSLTVSPAYYHTVERRDQNIPAPCETVLITSAGDAVPVDMTATPVFDEDELICIQVKLSSTATGGPQTGADSNRWHTTSYDSVITFDDEFMITAWNHGAEEMYGWTAAEAIGRNVQEIIRLDFLDLTGLQGNSLTGESQTFYARGANVRKDGSVIRVETQLVIVRNRYGDILHYAAIIRYLSQ